VPSLAPRAATVPSASREPGNGGKAGAGVPELQVPAGGTIDLVLLGGEQQPLQGLVVVSLGGQGPGQLANSIRAT
jgi:hypothetical protein